MSEGPILQLAPAPAAPEPDAASETAESIQQTTAAQEPEALPRLDESQLTEAEKKAIDDFIQKVDVTNPDHVLLFGADAQKRIADFSQTALDAVKTQDTGEVGNMLVNLVSELKGFEKYDELLLVWEVDRGDGWVELEESINQQSWSFPATAESLTWNWRLSVYYR